PRAPPGGRRPVPRHRRHARPPPADRIGAGYAMTAKPPDFEPLAASDPVPGEPGAIAALGKRYAQTAQEITQQAASLRKLAGGASAGWKGKSGTVFAAKAEDLAARISRAQARYHAAAGAAARAITAEIGRDGLKDSWWDAHFSWVARFFEVVAVAVLVLAVVAIILACPFSAVLIGVVAAETASTAIGWTLFGLTI